MAPTIDDVVNILDEIKSQGIENIDSFRLNIDSLISAINEKQDATLNVFNDVRKSFDDLISRHSEIASSAEVTKLAEFLQSNADELNSGLNSQKQLLEAVSATVNNIISDKSDKAEILNSIDTLNQSLKIADEKIEAADKHTFNLNQNLLTKLEEFSTRSEFIEVNSKIETILRNSKDTIDGLRFFNEKNKELADAIQNLINSDDYIHAWQKIDNIASQTTEITSRMSYLPLKSDTDNILMSIDGAKEKISENIRNSLENNFNSFNDKISDLTNDVNSKIAFLPQKPEIEDISSKIHSIRDEIKDAVISNSAEKFEKINNLIQDLTNGINGQQQSVLNELQSLNSALQINELENNIKNLEDLFSSNARNFNVLIFDAIESIKAEISEKSEKVGDSIIYNCGSIPSVSEKISKLEEYNNEFKNSMETIRTMLSDVLQSVKVVDNAEKSEEINNSLEALKVVAGNISKTIEDVAPKCLGLELAINNLVSNDKFEQTNEKIDNLCAKSDELLYKIAQLPLHDEVSGVFDDLLNRVNELSDNLALKTEDIAQNIDDLRGNIDSYFEQLKSVGNSSDNNENDFRVNLEVVSSNIINELNNCINVQQEKISKLSEDIKLILNESETSRHEDSEKINSSVREILDIKEGLYEISNIIHVAKDDNFQKLDENSAQINENLQRIISNIDDIKSVVDNGGSMNLLQGCLDSLNYRFDDVFEDLRKIQSSFENPEFVESLIEKLLSFNSELQLIKTDIAEVVNAGCDRTSEAISSIKTDIADFMGYDFDQSFANLKTQIELSYLNIGSDIKEFVGQNNEAMGKTEQLYNDIQSQLASIEDASKNVLPESVELLKIAVDNAVRNLEVLNNKHSTFVSKFENNVSELKVMTSEGVERTIAILNSVKDELEHGINNILLNQTDKTEEVQAIQDAVNRLGEALKGFVTDACENSLERVNDTLKEVKTLGSMVDNNGEISTVIEKIKNVLVREIDEKLQSHIQNQTEALDKIKADINSYIYSDKIEDEKGKLLDELYSLKASSMGDEQINKVVEALEERVRDINAKNPTNDYFKTINDNSQMNIINELAKVKGELEFCLTESQGSLNDISDRLDEIISLQDDTASSLAEISKSGNKIEQTLNILHSKVDILAQNDSDDFDFAYELEDLKSVITSQISELKSAEDSEITKHFDDCLNDLLKNIENIDKNSKDVKDSIISAIVSVFDQVSFVEETEEIKDFLEEKTGEINDRLKEVRDQLQLMATGDNTMDYSYTLQDVESDIAKLRIAMNEINTGSSSQAISELSENIDKIVTAVEGMKSSLSEDQIFDLKNDFSKLSEDMISISARTNKLLLNSDESYKALSDGLDRFGSLIYQLEDKFNFPDTTEISERIEKKVDALNMAINTASNNDKIFHQVLQYLGEWMDSVSESINSISEKTDDVTSVKDALEELKYNLPQKSELIEELGHKFEAQELRIDRLEMKLDNILMALEEHSESIVSKKLDKLEKEISRLSMNVEKITSYVDEE